MSDISLYAFLFSQVFFNKYFSFIIRKKNYPDCFTENKINYLLYVGLKPSVNFNMFFENIISYIS